VPNVWVYNNIVATSRARSPEPSRTPYNLDVFTTIQNRFDANTCYLHSLAYPHFSWTGEEVGWSRRSGSGTGTISITGRRTGPLDPVNEFLH